MSGSEVSALLGRMPSAVGYQPTLSSEMGLLQERIEHVAKSSRVDFGCLANLLPDALGELARSGCEPRRSIMIAHWDAEEYGIIGSTEWVEQFRDENITLNQARDWLVGQHPADLELATQDGGPRSYGARA